MKFPSYVYRSILVEINELKNFNLVIHDRIGLSRILESSFIVSIEKELNNR